MRFFAVFSCAMIIFAAERVSADSSIFAPHIPAFRSDIVSSSGDTFHNATTETFTMNADPGQISRGHGSFETINSGTFSPVANIPEAVESEFDRNGLGQGTSTFTTAGSATSKLSGVMPHGDLSAFRSSPSSQTLEFLFRVTGGPAASFYGGVGSVGFKTLGGTGFAGDSGNDGGFTAPAAVIMGAIVPEPGSFLLTVFGVVCVVAGARLRRRRFLQA